MRLQRTAGILLATALVPTLLAACGGSDSGDKVASDCKPKHTFNTVTKGTLTVAGYDLPPYGTLKDGKPGGIDMDILAEIAKRECLTVTPKWMAPAAVIPTVQSNRADTGVPDWYRTAARAEIVALTDPMYQDEMGISSKTGISKISDLTGKKVGTVDGYLWVADLKKYLGSTLKIYPSTVNLNQDLKAGRIDIAVDSYGSQKVTNPDNKVTIAEPEPSVAASKEPAQAAFPVPKSNTALLAAFNANIADMRKDGTLAKIVKANGLEEKIVEVGAPRLIK
ncbi:ABC transporter substrate-binding protein [Yimella sp. cx-51]|uniref:substrate-binding periplasmic protein n=1 Tax=Yimella sp. cx-51 TaxID=2770551 RepID=UPI00165EAA19|nr:transporter substrate-binding domain-containing protein [Yimella sp. cx-51]MBC9955615.1 amino acid ABC transporter substrate-binding protein [Yimella sp. cx-51]QTH37809.1 amino acid ABC transporter substrate-binding protein [Yimella sp. cx-51]